jgi:hypothetical protein
VVEVRVRVWAVRQFVPRAKRDGITDRVVGVGKRFAGLPRACRRGGVVGPGQAVQIVVGVIDDARRGGVAGGAGGDGVGARQGVGHDAVAHAQGDGVDSGPGVGVGVGQGQRRADHAVPVAPHGAGDGLGRRGQVGEGHRQAAQWRSRHSRAGRW